MVAGPGVLPGRLLVAVLDIGPRVSDCRVPAGGERSTGAIGSPASITSGMARRPGARSGSGRKRQPRQEFPYTDKPEV